jgi:hypothetical protein
MVIWTDTNWIHTYVAVWNESGNHKVISRVYHQKCVTTCVCRNFSSTNLVEINCSHWNICTNCHTECVTMSWPTYMAYIHGLHTWPTTMLYFVLFLEVVFRSCHTSKKPHPFNSLLQLTRQLIWACCIWWNSIKCIYPPDVPCLRVGLRIRKIRRVGLGRQT